MIVAVAAMIYAVTGLITLYMSSKGPVEVKCVHSNVK